jgi:nucleoside-diphosphate-sugar epimerase
MDNETLARLEQEETQPSPALVDELAGLEGDIIILGASGKVGPSLALMAKRAIDAAGAKKRIIGVARFSEKGVRDKLMQAGVETIEADMLDDAQLQALPEVPNVLYLVGRKFGTQGNEYLTWAINAYLPGRVADKFRSSRIVVFSTGNIYPFVPTSSSGAREDTPPEPVGEYAQSCLGRERVFEYFSHRNGTPILQFRLNYAVGLGYGVLHDILHAVKNGDPIDLRNGTVNVIWQGDSNEYALRSLKYCCSPPFVLNVTGPETASVRWIAEEFGKLVGKEPVFAYEEQPTALLSNASLCHSLFGYPRKTLRALIHLTWEWERCGGPSLAKPTHFTERQGRF